MINRKQLQNDIFLSDKQRATMDLDLQTDYLQYDDLDTRREELKDLVHESNPRPYHKNMVRIRDIGSSLSLLRNKVEAFRRTISTSILRFILQHSNIQACPSVLIHFHFAVCVWSPLICLWIINFRCWNDTFHPPNNSMLY